MSFDNQALTGTRNIAGFMMHVDHLDLAKSELGLMQVLFHSAEPVALTGTTADTALRNVPIPAGLMGANGLLRVSVLWTYTASANTKLLRVKLAGFTMAVIDTGGSTTALAGQCSVIISNRNSESSQIIVPSASNGTQPQWTVAPTTQAINTALPQTLTISGALGSAAELLTLERLLVEVLPT